MTTTNEPGIQVGVRAETGQLAPGMQQAANAVQESTRQMRESFERTRAETTRAMEQMREAVKRSGSEMSASMAKVVDVRGRFVAAVGGMMATLASGAWLRASIRETVELTESAERLGQRLGATAAEAGVLRAAMQDQHIPAAQFDAALQGLSERLGNSRSKIEAMGVATRDTEGKNRALIDIMLDGLAVLGQYKEGTDRNLAAQQIFGMGVKDVTVLLGLNRGALEETRKKHAELQMLVGRENVQALHEYRTAVDGASRTMEALRRATGVALMPVLADLSKWFSSTAVESIGYVKNALAGFVSTLRGVGFVVSSFYSAAEGTFVALRHSVTGFAEVFGKVLGGDFKGAMEAARRAVIETQIDMKGRMAQLMKDAANFSERIAQAWADPKGEGPRPDPAGGGGKTFRPPVDADKETKQQIDAFNRLLEARRNTWDRINELDGTMIEFGATQLAAFWKDILDHETMTREARSQVERRYLDAAMAMRKEETADALLNLREQAEAAGQNLELKRELAQREVELLRQRFGEQAREVQAAAARLAGIERELAAQRNQLTDVAIQSRESAALASLRIAEEQAQGEHEIGRLSKDQLLELEAAFELRRFEIRRQALQESLALVDPERNPVEFARRSEQLLELEREYQVRRAQLLRQQMAEGMEPIAVANRAFEAAWSASLDGLLKRTMTWGDAIRNVFVGTVSAIVMEIGKIPARWVMNLMIEKALKIKEIMNNAVVAASGAYAATAAIPFVGPALAPGAASLAFANVSAMTAGIAVARRGYDIPAGVNPIVQAHEREMILPAEIAEPARELFGGGGQRRGGDTIHIHAMDARSFEQFLRRNPTALARAGREAWRDGR